MLLAQTVSIEAGLYAHHHQHSVRGSSFHSRVHGARPQSGCSAALPISFPKQWLKPNNISPSNRGRDHLQWFENMQPNIQVLVWTIGEFIAGPLV